jgi:VWFA-related protein
VIKLDPVEENYEICYPNAGDTVGIAREMIDRRRERLTMEALRDLSIYLRGVREERKAVIAVSDGWLLYEPNRVLAERQFKDAGRAVPVPGVGPTGGLTADVDRERGLPLSSCEQDRIQLSMLDSRHDFMDLFDLANRANVSFYPVDSRGLPVFDDGLDRPAGPVSVDQKRLSNRIESLRTLAINTDGFAVVNNNDIESGLKRIADDVTSYYLLGYYSSNPRLDGKFRSISVRVKRPGVAVRHRRGYRAATEADVAGAAGSPASRTGGAASTAPDPVQAAFGSLAPDRREVRLRSVAGWLPVAGSDAPEAGARVWVVGELDLATVRAPEWSAGGEVEARLANAGGDTLTTVTSTLAPGTRSFTTDFGDTPVAAGEYGIRVRIRPLGGGLPLSDVARVRVPTAGSGAASARVFRRGPTTGGVAVATADRRFRRTERIRVEWPLSAPVADRKVDLVDRTGRVMPIPVTVSERPEPGSPWPAIVAELALAPLAEGEYALVLRSGTATAPGDPVVALRIVP